MKYASEIDELMSTYPSKKFSVGCLVSYINPKATSMARRSMREQVRRVLIVKEDLGLIRSTRGQTKNGEKAFYWKRDKV